MFIWRWIMKPKGLALTAFLVLGSALFLSRLLFLGQEGPEPKTPSVNKVVAARPVYASLVSEGDQTVLIIVSRPDDAESKSCTSDERCCPPMSVSAIPVEDNEPRWEEIKQIGELLQVYYVDEPDVVMCASNGELFFAYRTSWDAGPSLSFQKVQLHPKNGEIKKDEGETIQVRLDDGRIVEGRVRHTSLPSGVSLTWRAEFRKGPVEFPTPLGIFMDPSGSLCLIAKDSEKRLLYTWSKDGGKTWEQAFLLKSE
jgi:hypothetical protein